MADRQRDTNFCVTVPCGRWETIRSTEAVAKVRAIIGPTNIPDSEPLAQSALDKLHNGEIADRRRARCAGDRRAPAAARRALARWRLDDLPDRPDQNLQPPELKDLWSAFRNTGQTTFAGSIGRIETKAGNARRHRLPGRRRIARDQSACAWRADLRLRGAGARRARVVFKQEYGSTNKPGDIVSIDGVAAIHSRLDMVLLRRSPGSAGRWRCGRRQ